MAFLRKISPIICLPILSGCYEVFTPDMPHTPVLCVNSVITTGEPIEVTVSKSRLYTDPEDKSEVGDATVNIFANNQLQNNAYLPHEGDVIRIEANSESVGRTSAEVVVPKSVPIEIADWFTYDIICWPYDNEGNYVIHFKLNVKLTVYDPAGENYYRFTFRDPEYDNSQNTHPQYYLTIDDLQYDKEPIFTEHIGVFESVMGADAYGFTFFTDRQFAGDKYTLNLVFNECVFIGSLDDMPNCRSLFYVNSISPSYYKWANYVWQESNGILTDLNDFGLGEAVWGYSNCTSGAGVVAAVTENICYIDFSEFVEQTITNNQIK